MIGSSRQVFVDASGRRRRLVTAVGVVLGSVLAVGIALVVAGMVGAVPLPLPGLPASGQSIQDGERAPAAEPTRSPSPSAPAGTGRTPAPTAAAVPTATAGSTTPTADASTTTRGNRPTVHPGNPKSSRSR